MKLAIAVVYIVDPRQGDLLDLHLERVARHTAVPHTIYGSVTRLEPRFRRRLERHGRIRLFEPPVSPARGSVEHRDYLEPLIEAAVEDGATHVVTLHVDSFPVRDGWIEPLVARLDEGQAFATLDRINTACLLFPREFYLQHRPRMLASPEVQRSAAWREFTALHDPLTHCGVGYAFAAHRAGRTWYSMRTTASRPGWSGSLVYDDSFFHLQGALRLADAAGKTNPLVVERLGRRRFAVAAGAVRAGLARLRPFAPAALRRIARAVLPAAAPLGISGMEKRWEAGAMTSDFDRLVADPDAFLASLR